MSSYKWKNKHLCLILIECVICFLTSYGNMYSPFLYNDIAFICIALTYEFPILGAAEVEEQDDIYILVAPQNAVGNCIIDVRR